MDGFASKLLLAVVCIRLVSHSARAMKGLCSTDWFQAAGCLDLGDWFQAAGCLDLGDECKTMDGACRHDNYGNHGEGCACVKAVVRADKLEYDILTKDHFQINGNSSTASL